MNAEIIYQLERAYSLEVDFSNKEVVLGPEAEQQMKDFFEIVKAHIEKTDSSSKG